MPYILFKQNKEVNLIKYIDFTSNCGIENTLQVKNDRKQNKIKMAIILTLDFLNPVQ